ncbi:unnamed protein product [Commensalibacter communis]|uniref:hypothetical protein n=1 Tax=Commensalibacter communis TaxID=2972786 RepID=UPI0022FF76A5|nr:hypothetical protein [Commensalibacter communis]CAI3959788.1 unnamed protein product [Commensalibacter communis]CAI3959925.1 unnamed protein product [Commensalibacter communis]
MSEHQRQNYSTLWWGLQEVHLTYFPAWLDAGEPKDWTGLEDYQLKAVEGLTLFISLMLGNYLLAVQRLIDTVYSALKNQTELLSFAKNIYHYEYRFDLLSEQERCEILDICNYIERFRNDSGGAGNPPRIADECKDFVTILKKHKRDIEHQYCL